MKNIAAILCLLSLLLSRAPSLCHACIWDSDTLAMEAKGLPELPYIITGRFERNPPLYYEMRLKRVTEEITRNPNNLSLYDDAGVACDRLGKGDEAVAWMARKRVQLYSQDSITSATKDHTYRYYANLGTFLIHRWLKNGKDPKRMSEVAAARDAIANAIAINPEAHFGRERVQLYAIEWLMKPEKTFAEYVEEKLLDEEPASLKHLQTPGADRDRKRVAQYQSTAQALAGLVALGNAWESVDIFSAISRCLELAHDAAIETLTDLRVRELVKDGKKSLWLGASKAPDLVPALGANMSMLDEPLLKPVEKRFSALRANAEEWHQKRTAFMLTRMKAGKHPDTDPDFWNGYTEVPRETLDFGFPVATETKERGHFALLFFFGTIVFLGLLMYWRSIRRKTDLSSHPDQFGRL